jgi:hypothetical protein
MLLDGLFFCSSEVDEEGRCIGAEEISGERLVRCKKKSGSNSVRRKNHFGRIHSHARSMTAIHYFLMVYSRVTALRLLHYAKQSFTPTPYASPRLLLYILCSLNAWLEANVLVV